MTEGGSAKEATVLRPGSLIQPQLTHNDVAQLALRLYGLHDVIITDFNGYDDKNYHLKLKEEQVHKMNTPWKHGYLLKVMNSLDSKKLSFVEAQNELMIYLSSHGVVCPQPVKNLHGKQYSVEKISERGDSGAYKEHVVRLLTFQPGELLLNIPCTGALFFQTGRFIAELDQVLKGFHHVAYEQHKTLWMLESVPLLKDFIFAVQDQEKYDLANKIIYTFEQEVMNKSSGLEKGIIHGDFNEQNIVVQPGLDSGEWRISAVLDFGDSHTSYYVFELAITICYMMLQNKIVHALDAGGHVIAGYITRRPLPDRELQMLKTCVCGRLVQSLVLGAYSHLQDPSNKYLLTTAATGWELLQQLWTTPEVTLYERWRAIIASYSISKEHVTMFGS